MAATFLCSCRSKESVTKETSVSQTETHLSSKDSTTHSSAFVFSDTAYSNEETIIHMVVYDTSKKDSAGNCPILSVTDVSTKKHYGSKSKKEQVSNSIKVQKTKQEEKQKSVDKKQDSQKIISPLKEVDHFVRNLLLLIFLFGLVLFLVKFRIEINEIVKKLIIRLNN